MIPITEHRVQIFEEEWHNVEMGIAKEYNCEYERNNHFTFLYCVAYRHPSLPEWILARWYWNDEWIWTPDGIWWDQ